jgi:8-oxo-dGTP diphosphatase
VTDEPARPAAHAIVPIIRRDGRVLVIKRAAGVLRPGFWCPPSGRLEPGETQENAVVREIREELGIEATPVEKVWECLTEDGGFVLHWWLADADAAVPLRPDPAEVAEVRWLTGEEFLELEPTFENDRRFFEEVLPALG